MWKNKTFDARTRLKASGIHLVLSLAIGVAAAFLVFGLWYPYPYRELSGGRELFQLLVGVDVIVGPLITLAVFSKAKPRSELVRDLSMVAMLQLAALGYGLWTVMVARPVHLVFEFDRFRVVHAVEIPEEMVKQAPHDVHPLPLNGPTLLAVRPFRTVQEEGSATMLALQGLAFSARPDLWENYAKAHQRVLAAARPLSELKQRFGQQTAMIEQVAMQTGRAPDALAYLPLMARTTAWTILIDAKTAQPCAFLPLDSF